MIPQFHPFFFNYKVNFNLFFLNGLRSVSYGREMFALEVYKTARNETPGFPKKQRTHKVLSLLRDMLIAGRRPGFRTHPEYG